MPLTRYVVADAAPSPKTARYSHAVQAGDWLYITGQLPVDPNDPEADLPAGIEAQTEIVFENLSIILDATGYSYEDVVMARIFLSDFKRDYAGMNSVFHRFFVGDADLPARTTVGVAVLGRDALVEIDLVCYAER